jgi:hypothetical protein
VTRRSYAFQTSPPQLVGRVRAIFDGASVRLEGRIAQSVRWTDDEIRVELARLVRTAGDALGAQMTSSIEAEIRTFGEQQVSVAAPLEGVPQLPASDLASVVAAKLAGNGSA